MKKIIQTLLLVILSIIGSTSLIYFVLMPMAIAEIEPEERAVPVYQGMEVIQESASPLSMIRTQFPFSFDLDVDTNTFEPDFDVVEEEGIQSFVDLNETFFVSVKLANPDNFVILSFTLNGVFYQSFQFEDGSDSETLILEVTAGEEPGLKEYTIDAIKYIDGTDIKDVFMQGDKTIKVGVRHEREVSAETTIVTKELTSASIEVVIEDINNLTAQSEGLIFGYLVQGETVLNQYSLSVGSNNVSFEALDSSQNYDFYIVTVYDLFDGEGLQVRILDEIAIETHRIVKLEVDALSSNEMVLSPAYYEGVTATLDNVELYFNNELVATYDETFTFSNLRSNTTYTLRTYYTFDLNDGNGEQQGVLTQYVQTLARTAGTLSYASIEASKDGATINYNLLDEDDTVKVTSLEIFKNGILDQTIENPESFDLTELLSGQEYTVITNYDVDLNDGLTPLSYQLTATFNTPVKITPEVNIALTRTATTISYLPLGNDPDQILVIREARLYDNQNFIVQTILEGEEPIFTDLIPNKEYIVELVYEYDLNDGQPVVSETFTKNITTAKATPNAEINISAISTNHIEFDIIPYDPNNSAVFEYIRLYRGESKLRESTNPSIREFDSLTPATEYTIEIVIRFDLDDGNGANYKYVDFNFSTAKEEPEFDIESYFSTKNSIQFTFFESDIHEAGTITSLELIGENNESITLDDTSLREFNNLLSDHMYTLLVRYEVDINDGNGPEERVITQDIRTQAKELPAINPGFTFTKSSITYNLQIIDDDGVGFVTKVDLALNGEIVVENLDLETQTIENLLSNTTYELWVSLEYDMNDGLGTQEGISKLPATTIAKVTPVIDFSRLQPFAKSIEYRVSISDPDQVGSIEGVNLYDGETLVETLTAVNGLFETLDPDSNYTITIKYTYDLNDGNGPQTLEVTRETYTTPYIAVFETNVINTEKVTEGDTVVIELTIDNPSKINFTEATVNGQTFEVSNISTVSSIRVEIIIDENYEGGLNTFTVEELIGTRSGDVKLFELNGNNSDTAFVNGDINALELRIIDENDNDLESGMPGDDFFIEITFDNGSLYDIESVSLSYVGTVNKSQFTQSEDKQKVWISQSLFYSNTMIDYRLREFTYSSEELGLKSKNANVNDFLIAVIDSTYREISTVQEFIGMQNGYAYKLINDIDLEGIQWVPRDLSYIDLDGNGFGIFNFRNVKTINDTFLNVGLFSSLNYSTVRNLNIERSLTIITLNASDQSYNAHGGIIAGSAYFTSFINVSVSGEMSINNASNGTTYLGGFVGNGSEITIKDSTANVQLEGKNYVGGFVGQGWNIKIDRSYTSGELYSNQRVGALIGEASRINIQNSYSTATVSSNQWEVGGLVGVGYESIFITNSYFNGLIISSDHFGKSGLIGNGYNLTISNSFSMGHITNNLSKDDPAYFYQALPAINNGWGEINTNNVVDILVSRENYNDYSTYQSIEDIMINMASIWSGDTWSFGGNYPVLKTRPSVRFSDVSSGDTTISFDIILGDFEGESSIESIELLSNNVIIQTLDDTTIRRFDNLRYNTQYLIRVTYNYDYLDDTGVKQIVSTYTVRTLPVEGVPEITIQNIETSFDSVSFEVLIDDPKGVASISAIRIYDENEVLLETLNELELRTFTGLDSNTNYRIEIEVTYDLDDNYGPQKVTDTKYIRTNPNMMLTNTSIVNNGGIIVGDLMVLKLDIINEDNVLFHEATINGETYEVAANSKNALLIYMLIDENFSLGQQTITIESLSGKLLGNEYTYYFNSENSVDLTINGNISVLDIIVIDAKGEAVNYQRNNEPYTVQIIFDNPSQYDIETIVFKDSPWNSVSLEDNDFKLNTDKSILTFTRTNSYNYSEYLQYIQISSFSYSNDEIKSRTQNVAGKFTTFALVKSLEVIEIRTFAELQAIVPGYVYELKNDIDLLGLTWNPIDNFYGIIEGNNYTIKNFSLVQTYVYDQDELNVGFFKKVNGGLIRNLHFTDVNVILSITNTTNQWVDANVGILAGVTREYTEIENISVEGNISVTSTANISLGGLVGKTEKTTFSKVSTNVTIEGNGRIGGLIGRSDNQTMIQNAYSIISMPIRTNSNQGGLIGESYNTTIENAYTFGTMILPEVQDNNQYGALIGHGGNITLINVYSDVKFGNALTQVRSYASLWDIRSTNAFSTMIENHFEQKVMSDIMGEIQELWPLDIWRFDDDKPAFINLPIVSLSISSVTSNSIEFNLSYIDLDQVLEIKSISLYDKDGLVATLDDLSTRTFSNLRYAYNFYIIVTYSYDYGPPAGVVTKEVRVNTKTQTLPGVPEIQVDQIIPNHESVTFDINIQDSFNYGEIHSIELLNSNGQVIQSLQDLTTRTFNSLTELTEYTIKVVYRYDFNDEYGSSDLIVTQGFSTVPEFTFLEVDILTNGTIKVGDLLTIQIDFLNENNIQFDEIILNGHNVPVASQNESYLRVEFELDERFPFGQTTLTVDSLIGLYDNETYIFNFNQNNQVSLFVNGTIQVVELEARDLNGELINYIEGNQDFMMYVYFDNATGYSIESITISDNTYTLNDNQLTLHENNTLVKVQIQSSQWYSWRTYFTYSISSFVYDNDRIEPTNKLTANVFTTINLLIDDTLILINTIDDLKAIQAGYAYQLNADLDLNTIQWQPIENFKGYFDGNNHTISNLRIVSTVEDAHTYMGLFKSLDGSIIKNLNITNVFISINLKSDLGNNYELYIGGLVGSIGQYNTFENIHIDGEMIARNATNGGTYLGGITAYTSSNNVFKKVSFTGLLTNNATNSNQRTGGLVGDLQNSRVIASYSNVTIRGFQYVGGLIGRSYSSFIQNVYTKVSMLEMSGDAFYFGGLIGEMNGGIVTNAFAIGKIEAVGDYYRGGLIGSSNNIKATNVYAYVKNDAEGFMPTFNGYANNVTTLNAFSVVIDSKAEIQTLDVILQRIESLFDPTIWDFDNTLEGGHPTLK